MPYKLRKLPKQDLYRVYNADTGEIHSYGTTLENAKKQITLLNMVDAGVPLKKEGGAISQSKKKELIQSIRPITKEQAVENYLDLADEPSVPPMTSNKGNKFVDFFTFAERLETNCSRKKTGGITFWEFWENKSFYMKKAYIKRLIDYMTDKGEKNLDKKIYATFKLYFCSVGIFKPVIAMSVYAKYKPTSILDFTMGWGGRLVGAAALDIPKYTGIDLNKNLEKPYREMEKTLKELGTKTDINLIFKDALQVDYSKLDYDMVFTSPPYYNIEIYRGTNKMTEEEWNEKFYKPLFTETYKYLKTGGHYIMNVPIAVYENVLVPLFGKATTLLPMNVKRSIPKTAKIAKQKEYNEYLYVWKKEGKSGGRINPNSSMEKLLYKLTPVEKKDKNWIKRDDKFEYAGQKGGKARSALYLITKGQRPSSITTAGNRNSPQINIISSIGKKLGIPVVAFTATGELGNEVKIAQSKGATIKQAKFGYENVISARAREYAEKNNSLLIPFGMDTEEVHPLTANQVKNIPKEVKRIVVPVGSASSIIGIIKGVKQYRPDVKILGVVVGANPLRKLNKYVPDWKQYATLQNLPMKYHQPATITNFKGIELDPYYEAKTIPYIADGDLLWVVGVREGLKQISSTDTIMKGKGVETDLFENDDLGNLVSIPEINSVELTLPTYMYKRMPDIKTKDGKTKPPPYRFRLITPINKSRNIASRLEVPVVDIKRKVVEKPMTAVDEKDQEELPKLIQFSPADREKITEYYEELKRLEQTRKRVQQRDNQPADNKPRGFPVYMAKNAEKFDYEFDEDTDTYGVNPKAEVAKEPVAPKKKAGRPKKVVKETISAPKPVVVEEAVVEQQPVSAQPKKDFDLSDEQLTDLYVEDEDAFALYQENKEAFRKKYKGKYGRKYGFGIENKISNKSIGMNSWIQHTKDFAKKKGIKYNEALKDPECKASYKKGKGVCMGCSKGCEGCMNMGNGLVSDVKKAVKSTARKVGLGIVDEAAAKGYADQVLIADAYNQSSLGAQKKYISL
jgi:1-aminocyclopropane-1-carboxylate deaminase/D-cysteine desulfhydrase-like pyridoxal-dependent ACC family enzyme